MYNKANIVVAGGAGDCLLGLKVAYLLGRNYKNSVQVFVAARNEVFEPLYHYFFDKICIQQIPEEASEKESIRQGGDIASAFKFDHNIPDEDLYYIIPDNLYNGSLAFDWRKYNLHPQTIKSTRILTKEWKPTKRIYLGLASTTEGYTYTKIKSLINFIAATLPDYEIYVPYPKNWAAKSIDLGDLSNLPSNVVIDENSTLTESLWILSRSEYFVGTDNGPSHFAYEFGIPRLILDPQHTRLPWIARWKECEAECIPIETGPMQIAEIVRLNVNHPQTTLVDRNYWRDNPSLIENWKQALYLKDA